jgi:GT2 family glycosyltransferase
MTLSISGPPHTTPDHGSGDSGVGAPWVTAVLVSHDGSAWLPRCLEALRQQGADRCVAVDTGSRDDSVALLREALGPDHVVVADRRTGFGEAVRLGIAQAAALTTTHASPTSAPEGSEHWFWLLHDDCAPQPGALPALLDTAARSRQVGVVGPKLVDWDDPRRLLEVGLRVSRSGRRATGVDGLERDQGQHDDVTDVLALGSAGLLVRADVWQELGGFDPALPLLRDDIDLGWRAHLAGYRVVLAPRARVADAQAATRGLRSVDAVRGPVHRVDHVHGMRVALSRCSLAAVLPLLCWLLVLGLGRALGLLAAKAPRRSLQELIATATVLGTPWRWIGSRWRARGQMSTRRRDISQLLEPRFAGVRRAVDAVGVLAAHDSDDAAAIAAEPGPTSDEAEMVVVPPRLWLRRFVTHPLTLLVGGLLLATGVAWRGLLGTLLRDPVLTGGQLGRISGRPADLWHAAVGGWSGSGLGADVVSSPAALLRAAAATALHPLAGGHAAALAVLLLLLLAPALSAVAAYLALTGFVRSRWLRTWAALAWATLPVVATAVAAGRLGFLGALVLLPLVAAAVARALAPGRSGSTTATFAGALGVALLACAVPALLVPATLVAALGVVAGRGRARLRSLALLVVPLGLLGPWLGSLAADPRLLLGGPGLLAPTAPLGDRAWSADAVLHQAELLVRAPSGVPAWVVLLTVVPVLLVGLVGLLRAASRGRSVLALWALGLVGLAAVVVAPSVALVTTDSGGLGPWPGTAALLTALAGIGSAAVAADGLQVRLQAHRFGWRQVLVAPLVLLAVLGPVVAAGLWMWRGTAGPLAAGVDDDLPAVVAAAAQGPSGVRTLELRAMPATDVGGSGGRGDVPTLSYRLDGVEAGAWTRSLSTYLSTTATTSETIAATSDQDPVRSVVRDLVDGAAGSASTDPAVHRLGQLAVGFLLVRGDVPADVVTRLDATAGLARIGAPAGSALWRVGTGGIGNGSVGVSATAQERPARVRIESRDGDVLQVVPVDGGHASTRATLVQVGSSAPGSRLLVLSEPASSRWRATLDGAPLTAVRPESAPWRQAFALPDRSGHLVVDYRRSDQHRWQLGQAVLAALVLLLALPVRRASVPDGGPAARPLPAGPPEATEPEATEPDTTRTGPTEPDPPEPGPTGTEAADAGPATAEPTVPASTGRPSSRRVPPPVDVPALELRSTHVDVGDLWVADARPATRSAEESA